MLGGTVMRGIMGTLDELRILIAVYGKDAKIVDIIKDLTE